MIACNCAACNTKRRRDKDNHDKAVAELEASIDRGDLDHLIHKRDDSKDAK